MIRRHERAVKWPLSAAMDRARINKEDLHARVPSERDMKLISLPPVTSQCNAGSLIRLTTFINAAGRRHVSQYKVVHVALQQHHR